MAVAQAAENNNFAGLVDIGGGRKMYFECRGKGSPTVVLVGCLRAKLSADIPPDFGYITDAAAKKARERLAKLVPKEKHITNTNSGHEIHKEQPQLVIDAIREVVEAVQNAS